MIKAMKQTVLCATCILLSMLAVSAQTTVSIEGHRGARGYVPENTIPSFIKAIEQGSDTVELDVVITKDKKVLVSHDAYFSNIISLDPKGRPIDKATEREKTNIFLMNYSDVKKYDVGSIGNAGFPEQVKMKVHKPLLSEVFKALDKYTKTKGLKPVLYNIEIKSGPDGDGKFHPAPEEFAALVVAEVKKHKMADRSKIQSFDVRPLQVIRKSDPSLKIALLVGNPDGIEKNIAKLGFKPETYSPHFSLLNDETVRYCRENRIKLVPWTVNELADLEKVKTFQPDGVITDYPDRAVKVFRGQ